MPSRPSRACRRAAPRRHRPAAASRRGAERGGGGIAMTDLDRAKALALAVPAALLAGAYGSQYFAHLFPCEMCWYQRYAHFAALTAAILAYALRSFPDGGRSLVSLA